jgi:AcrR family transcriptional regulator
MVVKSKTPAKSKAPATPEKRTYVRRADIEERLVDTALRLLLTRDPESLTIREIAAQAKTHHRYIPDYFGGKGPLFVEVFPRASASIVGIVEEGTFKTFPSPELVRMIRLVSWLAVNEPKWFKTRKNGRVLEAVSAYYQNTYGLNDANARHMAQKLVAAVVVSVLYPEIVGFNRDQTKEFLESDRAIALFLVSQQKAAKSKK